MTYLRIFTFWFFYAQLLRGALYFGFSIQLNAILHYVNHKDIEVEDAQPMIKQRFFLLDCYDIYLCSFSVCVGSFGALYYIADRYGEYAIIQSGFIIPFWLFATGRIIRCVYRLICQRKRYRLLSEHQIRLYLIVAPAICVIIYVMYNWQVSLMIISILIGKFLWIDSDFNINEIKKSVCCIMSDNKSVIESMYIFALYSILGGIINFSIDIFLNMGVFNPDFVICILEIVLFVMLATWIGQFIIQHTFDKLLSILKHLYHKMFLV